MIEFLPKGKRRCRYCGEVCDIGGKHDCKAIASVLQPPKPQPVTQPVSNVSNQISNVSNKKNETGGKSHQAATDALSRYEKRLEAERNRLNRWRAANLDRYRENQRDLMRKRREDLLKMVRAI